jgi:hypothetical protein
MFLGLGRCPATTACHRWAGRKPSLGVASCSGDRDQPVEQIANTQLPPLVTVAVGIEPLPSLEAAVISAMISAPIREHNISRPLAVILTANFSGKEICNYLPMENQSIPEEAGKTTAIFGSDAHNRKSNTAKDCDRRKENFLTNAVGASLCNERTGAGPET